jgi:hypothetical protein
MHVTTSLQRPSLFPSLLMSSAAGSAPAALVDSPLQVAILATSTHDADTKKPYTLYVMSVHYTVPAVISSASEQQKLDWTVSRRYSDFEALRAKLAELSTQVPTLPGKSWFGSLSADLVATRKAALSVFLTECQQRPWICERPEWQSFLQVGENVAGPLRLQWQPLVIKEVKNTNAAGATDSFGVNDVLYLESSLVLFLGLEEQRIMQKVVSAPSDWLGAGAMWIR